MTNNESKERKTAHTHSMTDRMPCSVCGLTYEHWLNARTFFRHPDHIYAYEQGALSAAAETEKLKADATYWKQQFYKQSMANSQFWAYVEKHLPEANSPEHSGFKLVATSDELETVVRIAAYTERGVWIDRDKNLVINVTAWKELPLPPQS